MTVEATPFVVEKLSASVSGVHGRVLRAVRPARAEVERPSRRAAARRARRRRARG